MSTIEDIITTRLTAARDLQGWLDQTVTDDAARQDWNARLKTASDALYAIEDDTGHSLDVSLFLDCLVLS